MTGPAAPTGSQDLRGRAANGVMWSAIEKWMVRGSTFVGFVILGRLLSPEEFGIVALAMVFIILLTVVTDGGFTIYLVQRRTLDRVVTSTAFYMSTAFGLVLAPALALTAPVLGRALDVPAFAQVVPALSVALLISALSVVPAGLLQREMRFRDLAMRQVVATGLSIVAAVALALGGAGVWALVGQTLVRSTVAFVMLWRASDFRPGWTFSRQASREMLVFGTRSMSVQLLKKAREEGEALLVGVLLGTVALGLWTVALRLVNVVMDLGAAVLGRVATPVFARLRDDRPRLGRALGSSMAMGSLVLVPALVLLSLTSAVVVPAVFGEQWVPAAGLAAILSFRSVVYGLAVFHRSYLTGTGRPGVELSVIALEIAVQVVLVFVFAGQGLEAVALALAAWAVLVWPVRAIAVRRLDGVTWRIYTQTWLVLLVSGVAAASVLGANHLLDLSGWRYVALACGVGGAVYVGGTFLLCRPTVEQAIGSLPARMRPRARGGSRRAERSMSS